MVETQARAYRPWLTKKPEGVELMEILDLMKLEDEEIRQQLKEFFVFDKIQEEVDQVIQEGTELYQESNDHYYHIITILVPDRAGTYMQKQLLEMIGWEIDEEEYKDNYTDYIEWIERHLFKFTDELLEENLNTPAGVDIYLDYVNSDIALYMIVQHDYIPEEVKDQYIQGTDEDLFTNIAGGYISEWEGPEDDCSKYVYSFYDQDDNEYHAFYIDNYTDQEILEIIKDHWQDVLVEESGYTWDKALDKLGIIDILLAVPSMLAEFGEHVKAENHIQLFIKLDLI